MFAFASFVLGLVTRLIQSVRREGWWDSRLYRVVRWAENLVNERQWRFYYRWYQLRAFFLTRDPQLRRVFTTHLLFTGRGCSWYGEAWWRPHLRHLRHMFSRPDPDYDHGGHGIEFYAIGRNSSHEWSAGVKDGRLFVKSCGEDWVNDEPSPEQPSEDAPEAEWEAYWERYAAWRANDRDVCVSRVREVPPGESWGYCGHF